MFGPQTWRCQQTGDEPVAAQVEKVGYIVGSDGLDGGPARLVRLTRRGHVVYEKILDILPRHREQMERLAWPERFAELKELLSLLWESLSAR